MIILSREIQITTLGNAYDSAMQNDEMRSNIVLKQSFT